MVPNSLELIKPKSRMPSRKDLLLASIIFLASLASFGLGRLSVLVEHSSSAGPLRVISTTAALPFAQQMNASGTPPTSTPVSGSELFVASKNGTVYHLSSCAGAKRIKEENKIPFQTKEEAEARGLRPAANCPGLTP